CPSHSPPPPPSPLALTLTSIAPIASVRPPHRPRLRRPPGWDPPLAPAASPQRLGARPRPLAAAQPPVVAFGDRRQCVRIHAVADASPQSLDRAGAVQRAQSADRISLGRRYAGLRAA